MEGVLPLLKPKGMTSHDCVMKARKIFKTRKVGHTGTLDPDVTGVLPICIGRATKIAQYITDSPKTYEGEVTLGFSTTTEDASGEVVDEKPVTDTFTRHDILNVLEKFKGEMMQTPPMYSAVKVNGKKLYEYARAGQEVERPTRKIEVYDLQLLDERDLFDGQHLSFRFRVTCSKGTYVRTLAVDIGKELGYPAHMSDLVRTGSGGFTIDQCVTFDQLEDTDDFGLQAYLKPMEDALDHIPDFTVDEETASKVMNGSVLKEPLQLQGSPFIMKDGSGRILAIYKKHPTKEGLVKPEKVLRTER